MSETNRVIDGTALEMHWTNPKYKVKLGIVRFRDGSTLPTKGSEYAAGMDVHAWVRELKGPKNTIPEWHDTQQVIEPGEVGIVKTGLNLNIPLGYEIQVRSRSGLAAKSQVVVLNSPGTIDSDYSLLNCEKNEDCELKVILFNHGKKAFTVKHGDRIAQLVLSQLPNVEIVEDFGADTSHPQGNRVGGLGSTGVGKIN